MLITFTAWEMAMTTSHQRSIMKNQKQSIPEDRDPVLVLKMQIFMKTNPKNAHFLSNHFQLALKR